VQRVHLVEGQRQLRVVGNSAGGEARLGRVDLLQAVAQVEVVALRGQAAVERAGADGDQDLAIVAELAQHVHVLGVADTALDDADVAAAAVLDVGDRRAVELDQIDQIEKAFVDVEERHVAAEAAGERGRRDAQLARGRLNHGGLPAAAAHPRARGR